MTNPSKSAGPIKNVEADHVAVACEQIEVGWERYCGDLGGDWVNGGPSVGFEASTFRFASGLKVEVLQPYAVEQNDFLMRFLDRSGPGIHHITYKVPDLAAVLPQVEAAGYSPIGVTVGSPVWNEAFLHPKTTHGALVQLAQTGPGFIEAPAPSALPSPRAVPAEFLHLGHVVRSFDSARALFVDLLGGEECTIEELEGGRYVDIVWQGDRCIRLIEPLREPCPLGAFLGERSGRAHHLAFALGEPQDVRDCRPMDDGVWEVAPEDNLGVRLLLSRRS